ncbi:hypothetical protein ILUMI_22761 [Ignelater luminosus]|uniref:Uncharacterized protein n=1 Tax=Ignelater luminosus TaxID=2038154 RepID=A0A8K0CDR3_IGNLU|nr:hypothetical protein ILUMI_22761 [Ignelater luminosus]
MSYKNGDVEGVGNPPIKYLLDNETSTQKAHHIIPCYKPKRAQKVAYRLIRWQTKKATNVPDFLEEEASARQMGQVQALSPCLVAFYRQKARFVLNRSKTQPGKPREHTQFKPYIPDNPNSLTWNSDMETQIADAMGRLHELSSDHTNQAAKVIASTPPLHILQQLTIKGSWPISANRFPSRSCDRTSLDYFMFSYLKDSIFKDRILIIDDLRQKSLQKCQSMKKPVDLCINTNG